MNLKKRIILIILVYVILLIGGYIATYSLNKQLEKERFSYNSLVISSFSDDFIRVFASFDFEGINDVNFLIIDEYGNVWHNTTQKIEGKKHYNINLQAVPKDFKPDRKYIVYANFEKESVNSGYFYLKEVGFFKLVLLELKSWFSFMILENHLALGTYCDQQRMVWVSTKDLDFGKNYLRCQTIEVFFLFSVLLGIDIFFWVMYWFIKNKKIKKRVFY